MRINKIRDLAFCSILSALIIVMVITGIGYIPIAGPVYITLLTIPVLIGAMFLGKWYGMVLGIVFGVTSMIYSFVNPAGGVNAPFTNPILSVLPRAFLGFIIGLLYDVFKKRIKNYWLSSILTVIICQLIHSISVLFILYIVGKTGFFFYSKQFDYVIKYNNILLFIIFTFGVNGLLEIAAALITVPPINFALCHVVKKREIDNDESNDDLIEEIQNDETIERESDTENENESIE